MRIRRSEEVGKVWVEVQLEDFPREDESQEQFEERMVRLTGRLITLDSLNEKEHDSLNEREPSDDHS